MVLRRQLPRRRSRSWPRRWNSSRSVVRQAGDVGAADHQARFRDRHWHLRPPAYPYAVDCTGRGGPTAVRVGRGRLREMPWRLRRERGNSVGPACIWTWGRPAALRRWSPMASSTHSTAARSRRRASWSEGYAATPLTGVWANYPYLHNGSVPTLHHLLGPATSTRLYSVSWRPADSTAPGRAATDPTTDSGIGVNPSDSRDSVTTRTGQC